MARVQVSTGGSGGNGDFGVFPEDTYSAEIIKAEITESKFKDDKTGETKYQLAITWEINELTDEQAEDGLQLGKWVKQWIGLWYGTTKDGTPSKLKAFLDKLHSQELLPEEFDPDAADLELDTDWLVGIKQKIVVGVRGDFNTVTAVQAPRRKGAVATAPAAKVKPAPAVAVRNRPQPLKEQFAESAASDDGKALPF